MTLSTSSTRTNQDRPSTSSFDAIINNKNNSRTRPNKLHYKTDKYEKDETRGLSSIELQRLVLLEQLTTARAQKEAATLKSRHFKTQIELMDVLQFSCYHVLTKMLMYK